MAIEKVLPPSASSLSESMRDLGYSLETAVADIIDNSVAAQSKLVDVFCNLAGQPPSFYIIDNGEGMSAHELIQALRHGSRSPKEQRGALDLGRFGLGLKTASFSQCRQLTVITKKNGKMSAAQWDLDLVSKRDDWFIRILDENELEDFEFLDMMGSSGTMVVWRKLDRLFENLSGHSRDEVVNEKLDTVRKHLSLVFHSFLSGEYKGYSKLSIKINGHEISPFDPFCRSNKATRILPEEKVIVEGHEVVIQPYILPHHSKLSKADYDYYKDRSDFISNQGAYIYRNGRLMAWGDWFRLVPKGEATKLARVKVCFPNSMDEHWTIDIKKSRARPPQAVRARLSQIISKITGSSTRIYKKRGQKLFDELRAPLWERYAGHSYVRYTINLKHPLIIRVSEDLENKNIELFNMLLDSLSASLPVEMIYSDFSMSPKDVSQLNEEPETVTSRLKLLKEALGSHSLIDAKSFRDIVLSTRLFRNHMNAVDKFISENFNE